MDQKTIDILRLKKISPQVEKIIEQSGYVKKSKFENLEKLIDDLEKRIDELEEN